jgi:nucleoid-associated protein EbfC
MAKRKTPKGMRGGQMGAGGGGMMQQIQKMQEDMERVQEELAQSTVSATAGGGVVKVSMSGDQVCKGVEIDPELLQEGDPEMIQDLIMTAVNLSLNKSRELQSESMGPLTGGLTSMLPGMGL